MKVNWVELDGTANTRDLGGIPTASGEIAGGIVLRSDNLQDVTDGDVARLAEYPVTLVLDLRVPGEVEAEGPHRLNEAGVRHEVLPFIRIRDAEEAEAAQKILPDRTGARPAKTYVSYLEEMPDNIVSAFRLIARNDGATIIHCAAGKDRTGVLAAMLLDVAGADRDVIVADYLATNERIGAVVDRLRTRPIYAAMMTRGPVSDHTPAAENITGLLDYLESEWGGAAGWLEAHGLDEDDVMALRSRLTPGAP